MEGSRVVDVGGGRARAQFRSGGGPVRQDYQAVEGDGYRTVARSVVVRGTNAVKPLYQDADGAGGRIRIFDRLTDVTLEDGKAVLTGADAEGIYRQVVSAAPEGDRLHVEITVTLAAPILELLLATFSFAAGSPDFVHTPCLKQDDEDIIADRTFYQPAAILQRERVAFGLVPDLDQHNADIVRSHDARSRPTNHLFQIAADQSRSSMPTAFDVDLDAGLGDDPIVSYGFIDTNFIHHVRWHHPNDGSLLRHLQSTEIAFSFDVFVDADAVPGRAYQPLSRHLWDRHGAKELGRPRPQVEPFAGYADVCFPAAFDYRGDLSFPWHRLPTAEDRPDTTWQEFEIDGVRCGGLRAGPAQWYHDIQFMGWWNNARDAVAMHRWGTRLDDASLVDKARLAVNLALKAPQTGGLFPAIYQYSTERWIGSYWGNFPEEHDPTSTFNVWDFASPVRQISGASKTVAHLLRYREQCEDHPEILPFASAYGEFLLRHIEGDGTIPAFFGEDGIGLPWLRTNSEGGIHAWALAKLATATGDPRFLDGARRLGRYLIDHCLPDQVWHDQETFYSCARKPEDFHDHRTGQPARCTLSMLWAVEGLVELFEASGERVWLDAAEAVADYLSYYQAIWQPHFIITAYAFGGFGTQNTDCEWLDMRQAQAAEAFLRVGLHAGRQDLLERAVAALRAQFAIVNMPTNRDNLVQLTSIFPTGVCGENIDHEGLPQEPLRSGADWGEVGGLAAAATLLDQLGTIYADASTGIAVGVDGFHVDAFTVDDGAIDLSVRSLLEELRVPPERSYAGALHLRGLESGREYELRVNGHILTKGDAAVLERLAVTVERGELVLR